MPINISRLDDTYILAAGSGSWKWELEVGKRSRIKKAIAPTKSDRKSKKSDRPAKQRSQEQKKRSQEQKKRSHYM